MTAHARASDPRTSKLAAARISAAQAAETSKITPTEAVRTLMKNSKEFNQPQIKARMVLEYPGLKESGSICSFQRMQGIIAELEDAGEIEVIDNSGQYARYRYLGPPTPNPIVPPVSEAAVSKIQGQLF